MPTTEPPAPAVTPITTATTTTATGLTATANPVKPLTTTTPITNTNSSPQPVTIPNTSGTVTFQLVVIDNLGTPSAPVTAQVTIQGAPQAILGQPKSPSPAGGTITLDGSASKAAAGGTIASYVFSLLTAPTT